MAVIVGVVGAVEEERSRGEVVVEGGKNTSPAVHSVIRSFLSAARLGNVSNASIDLPTANCQLPTAGSAAYPSSYYVPMRVHICMSTGLW